MAVAAAASPAESSLALDPVESARAAGLRYVSDTQPGIRRRRVGRSFTYTGPDGQPIRDRAEIRRIRSIGVPPAWTDVWISPNPRGHLQATGRDAKGRKQYRYHPRYREFRDETKFERMIAFGDALPGMRDTVIRHLGLPGLPREKVLATLVQLLDITLIRVGNEEYAKANESYGLTTLRDEHVDVNGSELRFSFRGKSGKEHQTSIRDQRLARIVERMQDLPGEELFTWVDDDGDVRSVDSGDVNAYIRELAGSDFSAKDFRTWAGTVIAATLLLNMGAADSERAAKRNVVEAVKQVAGFLGNTPAIARKSYIHPVVLESYMDGSLFEDAPAEEPPSIELKPVAGLRPEEKVVFDFLRRRSESDAPQNGAA
jgi:DNA topoisomerase-1